MQSAPVTKYRPLPVVALPQRQWPNRVLSQPPRWCSVDLRDGNQALAQPMSVEEKLEMFELLVGIGFKEIEVGFPSASQIEFDFCRRLIEEKRIPEDVTLQILCQCREDLIVRSLEALRGARRVIFHLYNSTSPAQRKYVFNASREDIIRIATRGIGWLKQHGQALIDADSKIILNLPATVEYASPNVHADQIEWMCTHLTRRHLTLVSLHTHNDRGTGVAASELALLAGADRVEGTLFGNGERTGNLDLVTLALNLYTQGIHPGLDFSDLPRIREVYERTTRMEVHPRHPYAGDLVFTAFSGSHQDAIKKSWGQQVPDAPWDVLYIPIDPADIGRNYKAIIRINSQSGKGGVAYVLEQEFGYQLPKLMHKEIGRTINELADATGRELTPQEIHDAFVRDYIERTSPVALGEFRTIERGSTVTCQAELTVHGRSHVVSGAGNGPIDAFVHALREAGLPPFELLSYSEHSLGSGAQARAVSYIQIKAASGHAFFGAGIDTNIELASIKAIVSALNRALAG
jgi:2-isopropylmalate synthase